MSGYRHFSGLKGTKELHVGHDASAYEYTTINAAVAAAQANDTIVLAPGTHTIVEKVIINKPLRMVGLGHPTVTCSSDVTADMFEVELVAQDAACEVYFQDIKFIHAVDNVDVFDVDNTTVGQVFTLRFVNCDVMVLDEASTGNALDLNHSEATDAMILKMVGTRANTVNCVDIDCGNASDEFIFEGVYMSENGNASAIIADATDVACITRLHEVKFKTATKGVTGGHASQTIVAYNCCTESVGAALVTGDLAGSQTETVVSP